LVCIEQILAVSFILLPGKRLGASEGNPDRQNILLSARANRMAGPAFRTKGAKQLQYD
jgi:hypothetical protein